MISQMDGDGLNGFDKLGPKLSIGVVYPLTQQFELAAAGTFYRHGSDRGSFKISPNNTREDVLEMDIQSVGISLVFQWRPPTSRKMIGIGPVFHKIFDSNPTVLEFRGLDPPRVFAEDTFRNYFFAVKAFAGHEFSDQFRFIFTVELAVSNILALPIEKITKISPYSFSFTFAYEINPSGKKIKSSTRKKRI